jgi:hypothetical protein
VPHPDEPTLVAYVAEHSSATALAVYDATDSAAADAALRAAAAEIGQIRHPDEPDTALPNWCAVLEEAGDVQHAAWRSFHPFTGYFERLRAYGCTFGASRARPCRRTRAASRAGRPAGRDHALVLLDLRAFVLDGQF